MAALRALGATSGTIFAVYLVQVAALALIGVVAGLVLGAGAPILAGPLIAGALPIPVEIGLAVRPLAEAARGACADAPPPERARVPPHTAPSTHSRQPIRRRYGSVVRASALGMGPVGRMGCFSFGRAPRRDRRLGS